MHLLRDARRARSLIEAADIAAVAVEALTNPALGSADYILTGPEATYDEVARAITKVIGHAVRHCRLSAEEPTARYASFGMRPYYASILAGMDEAIAIGAEDRTTMEVQRMTGRPANKLVTFLATQHAMLSGG